jgi:multidrug efflux pump subunit AcrA (membrane-fusion protein)
MNTITSFFSSPFKAADPVAAAQAKVDAAQAELDKAKTEVARLESELNKAKSELDTAKQTVPLAKTVDGVQGGRRKRTYRKEKRPAKRRRNGRRSIHS